MSVNCRPGSRRAFTLVELMVAVIIATMLAATALMALWGAQEEAREARTRAQIAKINSLLLAQWQGYSTRNVAMNFYDSNGALIPRSQTHLIHGRIKQKARLYVVRDLMRMEMPDRMTDLRRFDNAGAVVGPEGRVRYVLPGNLSCELTNEPRLWRLYHRRIQQIENLQAAQNGPMWTAEFQGAECLYLFLASIRDNDASGLDFFQPSEIGDVDQDGMPEVLDGWGKPIGFLRWAAGFQSAVQSLDRTATPDHLDPLMLEDDYWHPSGSRHGIALCGSLLVPLVYSAGADEEYGLVADNQTFPPFYSYPRLPIPNDPYMPVTAQANDIYMGAPIPGAIWSTGGHHAEDNITNHLIEVR